MLEHAKFGVSHDTLGAALCESWGVAPQADLDPLLAQRGARRVQEQIEMAVERAKTDD